MLTLLNDEIFKSIPTRSRETFLRYMWTLKAIERSELEPSKKLLWCRAVCRDIERNLDGYGARVIYDDGAVVAIVGESIFFLDVPDYNGEEGTEK